MAAEFEGSWDAEDYVEPGEDFDGDSTDAESDPEPEVIPDPLSAAAGAYAYDRLRQRPRPRPRPRVQAKGVQHAIVRTPAGNARIELPSRVITVQEFRAFADRTNRVLDGLEARLRVLTAQVEGMRRTVNATEGGDSGAYVLGLEGLRTALGALAR